MSVIRPDAPLVVECDGGTTCTALVSLRYAGGRRQCTNHFTRQWRAEQTAEEPTGSAAEGRARWE